MQQSKKIVAIIPARSGSKGLRDKNIKCLQGKPMIAYTIEAAKQSGVFDKIMVSTDSEAYGAIGRSYGAEVPFLREPSLSEDQSSTMDVMIDTLNRLEALGEHYDYFMILQPTSPLRKPEHIRECVRLLYEKEANAVVSVCPTEHPVEWSMYLDEGQQFEDLMKRGRSSRQQCDISYRLNGAIYLACTTYYKQYKNFYKEKCYAYIMEKQYSVDIDDLYDFLYAEALLRHENEML